jgi:hypothetical protein
VPLQVPPESPPRESVALKRAFSEALLYHDDEALYFECRGKDDSIVRFSFEILKTLGEVIEEEQEENRSFSAVVRDPNIGESSFPDCS